MSTVDVMWKPDVICVSGDIAYAGKADDYRLASDWLKKLLDRLGLGPDRVLFCAGNHDIQRSVSTTYARPSDSTEADNCLRTPDTFGLGLLESTSMQNGNGRMLQETSPVVQGPIRVSIGVGTAEVPPAEAAAHGFPYFDEAFVAMTHTLAENLKKSLMNRPEVKLTVEQGGQHQPKYWSERFGPPVSFLFTSATEIQK